MSDATRQEALAKVEAYDVKVGYPDAWTDYSALVIRRDAFWANVAAAPALRRRGRPQAHRATHEPRGSGNCRRRHPTRTSTSSST